MVECGAIFAGDGAREGAPECGGNTRSKITEKGGMIVDGVAEVRSTTFRLPSRRFPPPPPPAA